LKIEELPNSGTGGLLGDNGGSSNWGVIGKWSVVTQTTEEAFGPNCKWDVLGLLGQRGLTFERQTPEGSYFGRIGYSI
jgi:hypothetical protein